MSGFIDVLRLNFRMVFPYTGRQVPSPVAAEASIEKTNSLARSGAQHHDDLGPGNCPLRQPRLLARSPLPRLRDPYPTPPAAALV
jgi:hypothetical protein